MSISPSEFEGQADEEYSLATVFCALAQLEPTTISEHREVLCNASTIPS